MYKHDLKRENTMRKNYIRNTDALKKNKVQPQLASINDQSIKSSLPPQYQLALLKETSHNRTEEETTALVEGLTHVKNIHLSQLEHQATIGNYTRHLANERVYELALITNGAQVKFQALKSMESTFQKQVKKKEKYIALTAQLLIKERKKNETETKSNSFSPALNKISQKIQRQTIVLNLITYQIQKLELDLINAQKEVEIKTNAYKQAITMVHQVNKTQSNLNYYTDKLARINL